MVIKFEIFVNISKREKGKEKKKSEKERKKGN